METIEEKPRAEAQSRAGTGACTARCSVSELLRWVGMGDDASAETDRIFFAARRVRAGVSLAHQGASFEHLYFVAAGTFKVFQTDSDGYEQVHAFPMRGDAIGLDGMHAGRHAVGAVALEDSTVVAVPFKELVRMRPDAPILERLLLRAASRELAGRGATLHVMAAVGSDVRVARFLLQMAQRQASLGYSPNRLLLHMSRRDIASHLGIAHETVSRSLTALGESGYIEVAHRRIELIDEAGLYALQRCTRGQEAARLPRVCARAWRARPASRAGLLAGTA